MRNLPREPIPGRDRVAVRVPEAHACAVYHFGQRSIEDPAHGQMTRDPQKYDVVTWDMYYYHLYSTGALETVGLILSGEKRCAACADLPWTAAHRQVPGFVVVDGEQVACTHHPDCPSVQPAVVTKPEEVAAEERSSDEEVK